MIFLIFAKVYLRSQPSADRVPWRGNTHTIGVQSGKVSLSKLRRLLLQDCVNMASSSFSKNGKNRFLRIFFTKIVCCWSQSTSDRRKTAPNSCYIAQDQFQAKMLRNFFLKIFQKIMMKKKFAKFLQKVSFLQNFFLMKVNEKNCCAVEASY